MVPNCGSATWLFPVSGYSLMDPPEEKLHVSTAVKSSVGYPHISECMGFGALSKGTEVL